MVAAAEKRMTLIDFLALHLGSSKKQAKRLLDERVVFVNDHRVWMARHELRAGDRVEVHAPEGSKEKRPRVSLLYSDEDLAIANKPAGVLSNGPGSLEEELRSSLGAPALAAVHRLDRDTSGCLVYARNAAARDAMVALFRGRKMGKMYHAVVSGRVESRSREITAPVDGQPACTRLTVLRAAAAASHVELRIETGRTHQIRRHMALIGHPVVGDRVYATQVQPLRGLRGVPRQMLHASQVSFPHPRTGALVRAAAPLPADFRACLKNLKLS
ncbi:MAG: RluA family pseudouridine synthase [Verrucomicrobiota bacterium]